MSDFTRIVGSTATATRGATGVATGTHMEDWAKGPAPWLNSIQTVASMALPTATAVSSAMGPWGTVAGAGIGMAVGSVLDGVDTWNTQKTVAELKKLKNVVDKSAHLRLTDKERDNLSFVLEVALRKKERHRNIVGIQAGTLQVAKLGTAVYRAGRAIHKSVKGTKGLSRDMAADLLLAYAEQPETAAGVVARHIVAILAKKNFDELLKASIKESLRS